MGSRRGKNDREEQPISYANAASQFLGSSRMTTRSATQASGVESARTSAARGGSHSGDPPSSFQSSARTPPPPLATSGADSQTRVSTTASTSTTTTSTSSRASKTPPPLPPPTPEEDALLDGDVQITGNGVTPMETEGSEERKTLLSLRQAFKKNRCNLNRIESHLQFIDTCLQDGRVPRGLRVNVSCNALLADLTRVREKFRETKDVAEKGFSHSLKDHYLELKEKLTRDLIKLDEEMELEMRRASLEEREEHRKMMEKTKENVNKLEKNVQETKKRKLELLKNPQDKRQRGNWSKGYNYINNNGNSNQSSQPNQTNSARSNNNFRGGRQNGRGNFRGRGRGSRNNRGRGAVLVNQRPNDRTACRQPVLNVQLAPPPSLQQLPPPPPPPPPQATPTQSVGNTHPQQFQATQALNSTQASSDLRQLTALLNQLVANGSLAQQPPTLLPQIPCAAGQQPQTLLVPAVSSLSGQPPTLSGHGQQGVGLQNFRH